MVHVPLFSREKLPNAYRTKPTKYSNRRWEVANASDYLGQLVQYIHATPLFLHLVSLSPIEAFAKKNGVGRRKWAWHSETWWHHFWRQLLTTQYWINGSLTRTGSVKFERMAQRTARFGLLTVAWQSTHCIWENNHATLEGTAIFYKWKYTQTSKTKTRKREIRFYYALSASKLAPIVVPSNQGVY